MADEQAVAAEPSPAAVETPEAPVQLKDLSTEQHAEWRKTGLLPEKPKAEKPASPDTPKAATSEAKPEEAEAETEPASEPGESTQEPEEKHSRAPGAEKRIKELLAKNKKLEEQMAARVPASEKPIEKKAEAKASPKPTPEDLDDSGKAKYATYEDFVEALSDWKSEGRIQAFKAETEKAAKDAEVAKQNKAVEEGWMKRVDEAKAKHEDFVEVAFAPDLPIKQGSVADAVILDSEQGAELLYYFGQNRAELERINALPPMAQAREIFRLEASLQGEREATPEAPAKPVTRAPKPAAAVGGKNTAPVDAVQAAVKRGDFASYKQQADQRDLTRTAR